MPKARIFNIMQYEINARTGETLITEEKIVEALRHRTIKRWAYICHDGEVYTALDEEQDPDHIKGDLKPKHFHIVIEMGSNAVEIGLIAKWFGIADNYVNIAKGHGAFLDCCEYLTHEKEKEQLAGKRLYPDEAVRSNFPFRDELNKRAERKLRYGRDLTPKDALRHEVLFHGKTLESIIAEDPLAFQNDMQMLEFCRAQYMKRIAPKPLMRINLYIEGRGGLGKGLISKAIAKRLIDPNDEMLDSEIYFQTGTENSTFEGYNGQPVIIWNDTRAETLLKKLGGRENVFNTFDTFPPDVQHNIKYKSIRLTNSINIVNSPQPFETFVKVLAGEEDAAQSYRRFPLFIRLREEEYDLGVNKGVFEGTREYEQYLLYQNLTANFMRIEQRCKSRPKVLNMVNGQAVLPIAEKFDKLKNNLETLFLPSDDVTDDDLLCEFCDVGYTNKPEARFNVATKELTEAEQLTMPEVVKDLEKAETIEE